MNRKTGKLAKIINFFRSNSGLAELPLMIGLLIMAIAVPVATKLVQENQNPENRAYEPTDRGCPSGYYMCNTGCCKVGTAKPTTPPSSTKKCSNYQKCSATTGSCVTYSGPTIDSDDSCPKSDDCTKCAPKPTAIPTSSCQPSACDSSCKSKGSSGGACYGSECRCNAIPTATKVPASVIPTKSSGTCTKFGYSCNGSTSRYCQAMGNEGYWIQANEEFCGTRGCNSSTGMCNPDPLATAIPTFSSALINTPCSTYGDKKCDGKTLLICSNEQQGSYNGNFSWKSTGYCEYGCDTVKGECKSATPTLPGDCGQVYNRKDGCGCQINAQCTSGICSGGKCMSGCTYMGYVIGFGQEQCFNGVSGSDLVKCNADGKTASTHFTKAGCTNFTTKICCCNSYGLCVYNDTKCDSGSGEKQPDNSRCDVRAGTVVPTKVPTQSGCKAVGATVTSGGDCCSKNAQYKDSQLTCVDCKGTGETVSSASQCCSKKAENGKCVDLASSYVSPTPKASDPTAKPTTNLNSCGRFDSDLSKCTGECMVVYDGSSQRCVNRVNSCGQFDNDLSKCTGVCMVKYDGSSQRCVTRTDSVVVATPKPSNIPTDATVANTYGCGGTVNQYLGSTQCNALYGKSCPAGKWTKVYVRGSGSSRECWLDCSENCNWSSNPGTPTSSFPTGTNNNNNNNNSTSPTSGATCNGQPKPNDVCLRNVETNTADANRLNINPKCNANTNKWDFNIQTCNQAGREEICGGECYVCNSTGGSWTKDATKCKTGVCTQCPAGSNGVKNKGDADCDGVLDINDRSIWLAEFKSSLGQKISSSWRADFDCNGLVDINDRSVWLINFRNSL